MAKIMRTMTIDYEIWAQAKKLGVNVSEICEMALANFIDNKKHKPTIKELMGREESTQLNERLIKVVSRNPVQFAKNYAKMIHIHYGYKYTPIEVQEYAKEEKERAQKH